MASAVRRGIAASNRTRPRVSKRSRAASVQRREAGVVKGWSPNEKRPAKAGRLRAKTAGWPDYLILPSRNSTCLRTTGSYFFSTSLSVLVRAFFLVT